MRLHHQPTLNRLLLRLLLPHLHRRHLRQKHKLKISLCRQRNLQYFDWLLCLRLH
jgi:hypothetical protein